MQSGYLNLIYKVLMYEISIKKIFIFLLKKALKPKINVNKFEINNDFSVTNNEVLYNFDNIETKTLSSTIIVWQDKLFKFNINLNADGGFFRVKIPQIILSPAINTLLIWRNTDLKLNTLQRLYPIKLFTKINSFSKQDLNIQKYQKINKIDQNLIELDRRLRITEEIVEITPYIKFEKSNRLSRIPITKKPLYKSYFTEAHLNIFREALALQGKTKKINIEIVSIYDKFSIENFSSIKQDPSAKNLICYFNPKPKDINTNKMYYLIIGTKKNDNTTIKAIVKNTITDNTDN